MTRKFYAIVEREYGPTVEFIGGHDNKQKSWPHSPAQTLVIWTEQELRGFMASAEVVLQKSAG